MPNNFKPLRNEVYYAGNPYVAEVRRTNGKKEVRLLRVEY